MFEYELYSLGGVALGVIVRVQTVLGVKVVLGSSVARLITPLGVYIVSKSEMEATNSLQEFDSYSASGTLIGSVRFDAPSVDGYQNMGGSPALSKVRCAVGVVFVPTTDLEAYLTSNGLLPIFNP